MQAASGPSSLALTIRLMAGQELATEGFQPGQVGSSAMPHKMNTRSCERINGFEVILRGYLTMVAGLAGDQWNEGDVSCSVVRRVALDALRPTGCSRRPPRPRRLRRVPAVIDRELRRYLPFRTTKVLMAAVRNGVGREQAHEAIKEHAVAVALAMRETASSATTPSNGSGRRAPRTRCRHTQLRARRTQISSALRPRRSAGSSIRWSGWPPAIEAAHEPESML